jgi:hypothetical protein
MMEKILSFRKLILSHPNLQDFKTTLDVSQLQLGLAKMRSQRSTCKMVMTTATLC